MGSDNELRVALRDVAADVALTVVFEGAGKQDDAVAAGFENASRREKVLLREDFGRGHERNLVAVFHGDDCGLESDDSFAGADIALEKSAHGRGLLHVGGDFLQGAFLGTGGVKGKDIFDRLTNAVVELKGNAGLSFLFAALQFEAKLDEK